MLLQETPIVWEAYRNRCAIRVPNWPGWSTMEGHGSILACFKGPDGFFYRTLLLAWYVFSVHLEWGSLEHKYMGWNLETRRNWRQVGAFKTKSDIPIGFDIPIILLVIYLLGFQNKQLGAFKPFSSTMVPAPQIPAVLVADGLGSRTFSVSSSGF